jgi:hypothetical protein
MDLAAIATQISAVDLDVLFGAIMGILVGVWAFKMAKRQIGG